MSSNQNHFSASYNADSDLSNKQHRFVAIQSNGNIDTAGAGEDAVGVLLNDPESGEEGEVGIIGKYKVEAGESITAGEQIASDANGKAVTATQADVDTSDTGAASDPLKGSNVMGQADMDGSSGDLVTIIVRPMGAVPSTES